MAAISLKGSKTWPSILQRIDAKGRTYSFVVPTTINTTTITAAAPVTAPTHRDTAKAHKVGGADGRAVDGAHEPAATTSTTNGGTTAIIANVTCNEHGCLSGQAAAKASTLRRHYYPEGSWGWIVLAVGTLQAILNHGVQLSGPLYLLPAGERFHQPAVNSCGATATQPHSQNP
uniref:Monocarboxylate transporter n=1 Tax=Anopheles stephensi TaxID=30069 RepID=A0A182YEZ8_ANOST